ncbi:hypothetical protein Vretimale_2213 [Volvox reticuliferus]|nr:hypothetical protein Vretimale_2213 [Volvox reticuliferus]
MTRVGPIAAAIVTSQLYLLPAAVAATLRTLSLACLLLLLRIWTLLLLLCNPDAMTAGMEAPMAGKAVQNGRRFRPFRLLLLLLLGTQRRRQRLKVSRREEFVAPGAERPTETWIRPCIMFRKYMLLTGVNASGTKKGRAGAGEGEQ